MLTVNRQPMPNGLWVELNGTLEENVNLEQLVGPFEGELIVKCRGITRLNSVGVKTWMRYFMNLRAQGKVFQFIEVPQPVIEQLNMISNFNCGGQIVSVLLPYSCMKCQKEFVANVETAALVANQMQIPVAKCDQPDCGAQFDDDVNEYLYFMKE